MPSAGSPSASTSTARSWWTTAGECSGSSRARLRRRESMLLVADVGNTNTKIGVFDHDRLLVSWVLTSRREQTADEYGVFIETLLRARGIPASDIHGIAISNVVPPVQRSEEHTSELQSQSNLVCRLLLEKKNNQTPRHLRRCRYRLRPHSAPPLLD